jgi:CBS domain-containing protein
LIFLAQDPEWRMRTKDLMTGDVVTVNRGHSIWHAAQIMLDRDVSGLPVVDDSGDLVGIVTEGDLLRRIELGTEGLSWAGQTPAILEQRIRTYIKSHSWSVDDVMTTQVISVGEETPLGGAATLMDQNRIKRVPVVREGKLVGILSRKDLLRVIAAARRDEIAPGDDAIRRGILARLGENNDLQGAQLTVTVSSGVVHLGGTVDSDAERGLARVVAESIGGVAGVRDHIRVVLGPGSVPPGKLSDS